MSEVELSTSLKRLPKLSFAKIKKPLSINGAKQQLNISLYLE